MVAIARAKGLAAVNLRGLSQVARTPSGGGGVVDSDPKSLTLVRANAGSSPYQTPVGVGLSTLFGLNGDEGTIFLEFYCTLWVQWMGLFHTTPNTSWYRGPSLFYNGAQMSFSFNNRATNSVTFDNFGSTLNAWHNICLRWKKGLSSGMDVLRDGVSVGTPHTLNESPVEPAGQLYIGGSPGNALWIFNGNMARIATVNRRITDQERTDWYNGGSPQIVTNQFGSECTGEWLVSGTDVPTSQIADVSGNGRHLLVPGALAQPLSSNISSWRTP